MRHLDVYLDTGKRDRYDGGKDWTEYRERDTGSLVVDRADGTSVRYAPGTWVKVVTTKK